MKISEYQLALELMSGFRLPDPEVLHRRDEIIREVTDHLHQAAVKASSINTSLEWIAGEVLKDRDR